MLRKSFNIKKHWTEARTNIFEGNFTIVTYLVIIQYQFRMTCAIGQKCFFFVRNIYFTMRASVVAHLMIRNSLNYREKSIFATFSPKIKRKRIFVARNWNCFWWNGAPNSKLKVKLFFACNLACIMQFYSK